jgi:hypothetical protein
MITCVIQYTLDPHAIEDFEKYATTWPPIIARCGGKLTGYYLPEAQANVAFVREARHVAERRSFLRKV